MSEEAFSAETLQELRRKFAAEELVAVRVRSSLPKKKGCSESGELDVYLQRTGDNERHEAYYVREGMTITRITAKQALRGTRALVNVATGPLASLLGDTEGPSHVSWDTSNDERPNRKWKTWKGRVTFFGRIVDALAELLTPPPEEADFDLLSDFFSIDQIQSPQRKRKKKSGADKPQSFVPPPSTPRWYRMHGSEGCFHIANCNQLPTRIGAKLRVSVAYDLPSGNPMKHWSVFDFNFRKKDRQISFRGNGVGVAITDGNVFEVEIQEEQFRVSVAGFDIHRDLLVRIDELTSDADTDSAEADAEQGAAAA